MIILSVLWLLATVGLMILVYHAWIKCGTLDTDNPNTGLKFLVNSLFILTLIMSTLWALELGNTNDGLLRTTSGIFVLLGGLLLFRLATKGDPNFINNVYITPFWISIIFLLIWFVLALYVNISSDI